MTEYTTSSQAIREYLSSKERTKHWVYNRAEPPDLCYSPSVAPSFINDPDFVLPPASDAGSSHSLPPKMVLRYSDGRPDEAIPHRSGSKLRPQHHDRSRSGSVAARGPEEIRVLPTSTAADAPRSTHGHARSKSLPRNAYSQIQDPVPPVPPVPALPGYGPPRVAFGQTPQPWHGEGHNHGRHPPAIVYAPSHARSRPHYAPPAIYTHPPQMGPNGMIYSHSAPVRPTQKYVPTPYPSVVPSAHSHMSAVKEEERRRSKTPNGRSHSRNRRDRSPASSISSFESNGSGSTYYVMPTGRQKVHIIPTPDTSAGSSGHHSHSHSHSQSHAHSPQSPQHSPTSVRSGGSAGGLKKPFIQRILGFAFHEKRPQSVSGESSQGSATGSTRGGRRLRRHSSGTGPGSRRSKSVPPPEN
ncbi:hypothetical protein MIND_01101800 [Mycena indigotica]|uniref:Uncharacterized protein n=1 Tax=Mycena indigotica TaxID=2126181 RepID=A0A8H6SC52_9AGAR|nr:uncharacterized protein MIND_01101800 [Mycena indigotica]KAF7295617.1 hypothetical protein MIND_01101800 [Mycena indigotica]